MENEFYNGSFYQETPICSHINGGHPKIFSLKQMFEVYDQFKEVYEDREEIDMNKAGKFLPHTLTNKDKSTFTFKKHHFDILDADGSWTGLTKLVKFKRRSKMVFYQLINGSYAIVEETHPIMLYDGTTIEAKDLKKGSSIKLANRDYFNEIKYEYIDLPIDFAYFIGSLSGNEFNDEIIVEFTKNNREKLINSIMNLIGDNEDLKKFVKITNLNLVINKELMKIIIPEYISFKNPRHYSSTELPINILSWTHEAKAAFIAGLIDSKFTNYNEFFNSCVISLDTSYILNYLDEILLSIGIKISGKNAVVFDGKMKFSIYFNPSNLIKTYSDRLKDANIKESKSDEKMLSSIKNVMVLDLLDDDKFDYVYKIITDSGTFYSNGMTQIN